MLYAPRAVLAGTQIQGIVSCTVTLIIDVHPGPRLEAGSGVWIQPAERGFAHQFALQISDTFSI